VEVSSVHLSHLQHGLHQVGVELGGLCSLPRGPGGGVTVPHVGAPRVPLSSTVPTLTSSVLCWHVSLSVRVPGAVLQRVCVLSS